MQGLGEPTVTCVVSSDVAKEAVTSVAAVSMRKAAAETGRLRTAWLLVRLASGAGVSTSATSRSVPSRSGLADTPWYTTRASVRGGRVPRSHVAVPSAGFWVQAALRPTWNGSHSTMTSAVPAMST